MVGNGIVAEIARILGDRAPAHRYAVVTDSNLAESHAAAVAESISKTSSVSVFTFPAGEAHKTIETWTNVTDAMLAEGFGRDSTVVGVGGGVVGDMAGFVAATYMRGIPVVHIPTSLLAMVDSSIGGKTGVDVAAGKNLVGAFHQPSVVITDPETLSTLPADELRNGMAEAVKHGAIADSEYFGTLSGLLEIPTGALMTDVVAESVRIKTSVVSQDEFESGKRAILNFGHTIGHAIEFATGFSTSHGEAVAIGMVAEAHAGERLGVTEAGTSDRLQACLAGLGLPVSLPAGMKASHLIELMQNDKKARLGSVRFSLLEKIGAAANNGVSEWTHEVDRLIVKECIEQLP
jgi:3-dehydroquinate synthase